jgi:uncharacterized protein (DUF1501 family)
MAITRRQFIKRTGLATAGTLLGPGLFSNPFVRQAMADTIGNRYLVVLFLDGGNDGLNTVIPYQTGSLRAAYDANRRTDSGGINVTQGQLDGSAIGTGGTLIGNDPGSLLRLALHPGFASLKQLYDLGKVAVIQGCGYPEYNLSHDQSRTIWETANPLGVSAYSATGWVGRHLAGEYTGTDIPGVCISDEVAPEFRQTATSVLAINRLRDYGFPYDDDHGGDQDAKRTAFQDLYDNAVADAQPLRNYLGDSGTATLLSSESYPQAHGLYENDPVEKVASQTYDDVGRSTATDLREIAKIIFAVEQGSLSNVNAHFFRLSNGGYDTHSDQGGYDPANGQQHGLHAEVGDSLKAFYNDLANMSHPHDPSSVVNRVCVVVWSEFSRRIPQNDNGTDHGSQGPMFVVGGSVVGGVYGRHPDIANLDDNENTVYSQAAGAHRSTDFRDVFGTILKHHVNMTQANILASVLPLDPGNPANYWTVPNFDLGFLP